MKLLNLDEEHEDLCVPNVDYACTVRMPSKKFERICKDLSEIGEQMVISCARGGNLTYSFQIRSQRFASRVMECSGTDFTQCDCVFLSILLGRCIFFRHRRWIDDHCESCPKFGHWQRRWSGHRWCGRAPYNAFLNEIFVFDCKSNAIVQASTAVNVSRHSTLGRIRNTGSWLHSILFGRFGGTSWRLKKTTAILLIHQYRLCIMISIISFICVRLL